MKIDYFIPSYLSHAMAKGGLMHFCGAFYEASLTNIVRNKETNEQMHGRNIRSGGDTNQGPRAKKSQYHND